MRSASVGRWWGPARDDSALDAELIGAAPDAGVLVIEVGGEVAGFVEYYEQADPDYHHATLDIALAEEFQGGGLGPESLRVAARWLAAERGHHRFTIDPAVTNERAIAAYARVGFRPVGVLRCYERGVDGTWHDNLLMDMLAEEITPDPV